MIVLDTNVISEVMKPVPDPHVMTWLRGQPLQALTITAVSVAEISYGLRLLPLGRRRYDLATRFRTFLNQGFSNRILAFRRRGRRSLWRDRCGPSGSGASD